MSTTSFSLSFSLQLSFYTVAPKPDRKIAQWLVSLSWSVTKGWSANGLGSLPVFYISQHRLRWAITRTDDGRRTHKSSSSILVCSCLEKQKNKAKKCPFSSSSFEVDKTPDPPTWPTDASALLGFSMSDRNFLARSFFSGFWPTWNAWYSSSQKV